jgi:hypothetical protein
MIEAAMIIAADIVKVMTVIAIIVLVLGWIS